MSTYPRPNIYQIVDPSEQPNVCIVATKDVSSTDGDVFKVGAGDFRLGTPEECKLVSDIKLGNRIGYVRSRAR